MKARARIGAFAAVLATTIAAAAAAPAPARAQAPCPSISAASAIVVEATTGALVCARAPDQRRAIASATKLMTALLVLERAQLSDLVPAARYRALPIESKINLRTGERMTIADLLRGLLLASANDASVTLADHVAGSRPAFVREMNARARAIGLRNTHFANPIGLDAAGNFSSARDLATLTLRLRRFPFFRRTVDRPGATLRSGARIRNIVNRNRLVRRLPWIDGVKTGHTLGAGYVLIGSGEQRDVPMVSVVLGTPSEAAREADTVELLRHGIRLYRYGTAVRRGEPYARVPIRYRSGAAVALVAGRTVKRVIRRGTRFQTRAVGLPDALEGPIRAGDKLAALEVYRGRERVTTVALVAASDVPAAGAAARTKDFLLRPRTLGLAAILGGASVLLGLLRRRGNGAERSGQRRETRAA